MFLAPLRGVLSRNRDMTPIPEARISILLTGNGVLVLGVATTTVAGLLLLRSMRRRREIAVKLALGMGRGRLASLLFSESLLLAALGGIVSAGVVISLGAYVNRFLLPDLSWDLPPFDWKTAAVGISCILGAAGLATLAPLFYSRFNPASDLRDGARPAAQARTRPGRAEPARRLAPFADPGADGQRSHPRSLRHALTSTSPRARHDSLGATGTPTRNRGPRGTTARRSSHDRPRPPAFFIFP